LEEGSIDSETDYWGKSLFGEDVDTYKDKSAFTSGILLFKRCDAIQTLFREIKEHIQGNPRFFSTYDQPYIVYHAFKQRLYENKTLGAIAVNNDENIDSDKVIHHFPGTPGLYQHKLNKMSLFLAGLVQERISPYVWKKGMVFYLK
jgi:hypothetical protein